jgi:hypothetical protein
MSQQSSAVGFGIAFLTVAFAGCPADDDGPLLSSRVDAGLPLRGRSLQAEWMKLHAAEIRLNTLGIAFVISSPLVRGALTAILWLQPLACPHLVTADLDQGIAWARQKVASRSSGGEPSA